MSQPAASLEGTDWRRAVEPFVGPDAWRASFQLATTLLPLALLMWGIHAVLPHSVALALLLTLPTAGLLVRTFIVMHDCAHGSFFASRRVNDTVGFVTGVLTLTPFTQWRRDHALHHASSGDLDRRGHGDVPTLTVREYLARSPRGRLLYRILRHPAALLLGGPLHLAIGQRLRGRSKATGSRQIASVWATNAGIALLLGVALWTVGWRTVLVAYALPYYLAAMAGVWLFYVQHQFEDAYWAPHGDWDYVDAALLGSSHLRLPAVLQWFTGSIGLHHVHHVAPRIPNFRLQSCHDANPLFARSPVITPRSGMASLRLALWDEDQHRLVRFRDVTDRQPPRESMPSTQHTMTTRIERETA
ncbi:MAG TPA: fatty acid desaturase [Gemmatimonadaceae bacterium]|nr:fatty acid desaturase [Gemmatimonadaceae bacterium]